MSQPCHEWVMPECEWGVLPTGDGGWHWAFDDNDLPAYCPTCGTELLPHGETAPQVPWKRAEQADRRGEEYRCDAQRLGVLLRLLEDGPIVISGPHFENDPPVTIGRPEPKRWSGVDGDGGDTLRDAIDAVVRRWQAEGRIP